jgi:hypothetical protein
MGLLLIAGAAFMTTGCAASLKSYPYTMMDTHVQLNPLSRKDYKVLGAVEGTAHCSGIFSGCWTDGEDKDKHFSGTLLSDFALAQARARKMRAGMMSTPQGEGDELPMVLSEVEQAALYNAMEKQPEADGVINLVITKGTRTSYVIFTEETVTVRATAIKIKNG